MAEVGMNVPAAGMLPSFKGQPWVLFDTIASSDFTVGSDTNALGSDGPAIGNDGLMIFFNGGRNKKKNPNLTNVDLNGQLSYGFNCWAIALEICVPQYYAVPSINEGWDNNEPVIGTPPTSKLAEALLNFGVVICDLGQEEQSYFPATAFGSGGGLWNGMIGTGAVQNGPPDIRCVMTLPEPIAMGRTQNFSVTLQVASFMFDLIGKVGALGVGQPLEDYQLQITGGGEVDPTYTMLPQPPYAVKCKLIGERVHGGHLTSPASPVLGQLGQPARL